MKWISTKLLCFFYCMCWAQTDIYVPNQIIVQFKYNNVDQALIQNDGFRQLSNKLMRIDPLVPGMSLFLCQLDQPITETDIREWRRLSMIRVVQRNKYLSKRSLPSSLIPNDSAFTSQWHHINFGQNGSVSGVDMDSDQAWVRTTGGLTSQDDTLVVAIVDDGFELNHEDLVENRWINHREIPNNNIDDDQNGYVDDYLGWNPLLASDEVAGGSHGTQVSGIIGAVGDNQKGVVGVNWDVKMMMIRNDFNTTEASVLASYGYAYNVRKRYNESNGEDGHFVVATNSSWGVDFGQVSDSPLWCAMYDSLGRVGILSIGATANNAVNVDSVGDLPTTCPSDYLISVTNINKLGQLHTQAAYGLQHIDIGAFGEEVFTTKLPNTYGIFGGTSASAPQVTGAVALLYSAACPAFIDYARVYPDSAALLVKSCLLDSVTSTGDLTGRSVSGGYLNLDYATAKVQSVCPSSRCLPPFNINEDQLSDTSCVFTWDLVGNAQSIECLVFSMGVLIDSSMVSTSQGAIQFTNLEACKTYQIVLRSFCGSQFESTDTLTFTTRGCCIAPTGISVDRSDPDQTQINWSALLSAQRYIVHWRKKGTTSWMSDSTSAPFISLVGLDSCSVYDCYVSNVCKGGSVITSDTVTFINTGCTTCGQLDYCLSAGQNTNNEWIQSVSIDNIEIITGDNGGYWRADSTLFSLTAGFGHDFTLKKGGIDVEFVKVWIDVDQNGTFSTSELVLADFLSVIDSQLTATIQVPNHAIEGLTRMRVSMQWNSYPEACGLFQFGEVEDYCVNMIAFNSIDDVLSSSEIKLYPNPTSDHIILQSIHRDIERVDLFSTTGQMMSSFQVSGQDMHKLDFSTLENGWYLIRIVCSDGALFYRKVQKASH